MWYPQAGGVHKNVNITLTTNVCCIEHPKSQACKD